MRTLKSEYGSAVLLCMPSTFRCWWEAQPSVLCPSLGVKNPTSEIFSRLGSAKRDLAGRSREEVSVANTPPGWQVSLCTPWTRAQLWWASRRPCPSVP